MRFTLFSDKTHVPILLEESARICRISNDPLFIFRSFVNFLQKNNITLPGYTTFQEKIVSVAVHAENKRLHNIISGGLSKSEQKSLLTLLEEEDGFYTITSLKKNPKNFKRTAIKKECTAFETLRPLYKIAARILPLLNIAKRATQYYASLVDHYTVQGLGNINKNQRLLWLICFVFNRHKLMIDNLTMMLIYTGNKFKTTVDARADELLLESIKKPKNTDKQVAKALRFYSNPKEDDTKALSHFKKKVYKFLPLQELDEVIDVLENRPSSNHYNKFKWLAVDELTPTYKTPLRLLIKSITLNGDQYSDLQDAHIFLKKNIQNEIALSKIAFDKFPVGFISNSNAKFIYNAEGQTVNINRFEFECYHRIAKAINQSSLYVENAIRFGSLRDELIPNWATKKNSIIKSLNNDFLNKGIQHFIDTYVKFLDEKIKIINEDIITGHNKSIKIKKDKKGEYHWTLPSSRKNKPIDNPFYLEFTNMGITQLLKTVNEKTGFIREFTHIKSHYAKSKMDEIAIIAAVVANSINIGVGKMATLCDVDKNDLNNADKNYIRLSTLRAANDCVSNATAQLPIFKDWNLLDDKLLASADGQKMRTERETLLSRYAQKYFGQKKGVVSYLINANHVPINALVIGANMHESHFLFDLLYNNTSDIKPDVLSTDTEGANQLNFLFLHVIDKLFAPRYRNLSAKTSSIISFGPESDFKDYLIKPNCSFNEKLVLQEEDNILHVVASLLSGEGNQSNIVKKLSSSDYKNSTKEALWELNAVLMSHHLLDFIGDIKFRQAIQGVLCRGESYHQLRRVIAKSHGKNFRGSSDNQIMNWNECARFLTNCIIHYNATILNDVKFESDRVEDFKRSELITRFSPAGFSYLNFQGKFVFLNDTEMNDIDALIKRLYKVKL